MFLNQKSLILIKSNYFLIQENIFNPKYYKKETKENFQKVFDFIVDLAKKEYRDGNNIFFNPKSEELKKIKENFLDFKKFLKETEKIELKSPIIVLEKNIDPNIEANEKVRKKLYGFIGDLYAKHFKSPHTHILKIYKNDKNIYTYLFIINVPKTNYLKKFFQGFYKYFGKFYDHQLLNNLMYYLAFFHEMIEANESIRVLNGTSEINGIIILNYKDKDYIVGNHQSLVVLAKEAYILNKFYKEYEIINEFREFRKNTEWFIIKEVTGFDFSKIDSYDEAYFDKLRKISPKGNIIKYVSKSSLFSEKQLNNKGNDFIKVKEIKNFKF